jgi:hypothetical protein
MTLNIERLLIQFEMGPVSLLFLRSNVTNEQLLEKAFVSGPVKRFLDRWTWGYTWWIEAKWYRASRARLFSER